MVQRTSPQRKRRLEEFGRNVARWRRVNGMSASELAERAAVTRATLRGIEAGSGTAGMDSLFAVLIALGIDDSVVRGTDPYSDPAARARIDDILARGGEI